MWTKITNPKTGRKVSITSKLGKNILNNYIKHLQNGGSGRAPSCKNLLKAIARQISSSREATSRSNKGEIDGNPLWAHTSDEQTATSSMELQWYSGSDLTKSRADRLRRNALGSFQVDERISQKLNSRDFTWINQGGIGGCSFACLSNICQLANIDTPWNISSLKTEAGFGRVYQDGFGCDDSGYNDWLSVISSDFCAKIPNFNRVLSQINFVAFKIRQQHNKLIGEGLDKEEYGQAVFDFICNLLDEGNVVGIPFLQHFITVIGHNGTQLLFLGSFGKNYDQGGLHIMNEDFSSVLVGDALNSCIFAPL